MAPPRAPSIAPVRQSQRTSIPSARKRAQSEAAASVARLPPSERSKKARTATQRPPLRRPNVGEEVEDEDIVSSIGDDNIDATQL